MANRYWVGGTGTWDASSTTNWSATSGGASGASAPTINDSAFFDSLSGTGTCTTASGAVCTALTMNSSTLGLTLGADLTMANAFTLTLGAVNLVSYNLTCGYTVASNTNVRSIAFGTGRITLTAGNGLNVWGTGNATNFSYTGSGDIYATYAGAGPGGRNLYHGTTAGATEANTPNFYVTAGTDTVSLFYVKKLDFTGFAGTLDTAARFIYGDLTLSSGMTLSATANATTFQSTSGTPRVIASNGKTLDCPVTFNGAGGSWTLADALTVGSTRTLTLTNGTLNGSGQNVSLGSFALGSGTKTLTLGTGTWTVTGANWNANTNVAGLTVSASTGTISMTSSSAKIFSGGAKTWPTLNQGGSGALTVRQSNTFANITNSVQPATITLTSGTTQTVTNFTASGTSGNLITLNSSTPGSRATLLDNSGTVSVSYMSITDIAATGSADWQSYTSNGNVDAGNNIGWEFINPVPVIAIEYPVEFRSFTEKRRF